MTRVALRGLRGRKLRTAPHRGRDRPRSRTGGRHLVLTDSIQKAFDNIFTDSRQGSSVVISGKSAFDLTDDSGATAPPIEPVAAPDSPRAAGCRRGGRKRLGDAQIIGDDGKAIVYGGAPNLGFSIENGDSRFNPLTLVEGEWPTAGRGGHRRRDRRQGGLRGRRHRRRSGPRPGRGPPYLGHREVRLGLDDRRRDARRLRPPDRPAALRTRRASSTRSPSRRSTGVSDAQLASEIRTILPRGHSGADRRRAGAGGREGHDEFISFLRDVPALVRRHRALRRRVRDRELALDHDRAAHPGVRHPADVGASRRQVLRSMLLESLVIGVVASVVGLFLGLALAKGLFWLFDAVGFTLPNSGLVFETRTIIVALARRHRRHGRREPASRDPGDARAADRGGARGRASLPESRFARFRRRLRCSLTASASPLCLRPLRAPDLERPQILLSMGAARCSSSSASRSSPRSSCPPLATCSAGRRSARRGRRAGSRVDNAKRNPQRTASTAAALMIGLALVTLVAVLAAGDSLELHRRRGQDLRRRLRDHGAEQLLADPDRRRRRCRERAGRRGGRERPRRRGARLRQGRNTSPPSLRMQARRSHSTGAKARKRSMAARRGRRVHRRRLREDHNLRVGSPIEVTVPDGEPSSRSSIKGIFDPPPGGSPFGT